MRGHSRTGPPLALRRSGKKAVSSVGFAANLLNRKTLQSLFLLLGGIAMIVAGSWIATSNAGFVLAAQRAPGIVVDLSKRRVRGATLYHPVVRFRPAAFETPVQFTAQPGLWPSPFDVGDEVTVLYDNADPADARIESFWTLWFLPLATALLGAACLFAAWDIRRRAP